MNDACILALVGLLIVASAVVILVAGRSIWREIMGLANNEDAQAERRTEERKNARIAREIEQWRNGQ